MKTPAKLGLLASLYISQGLPFGFFTQALPVLLRDQGMSLPAIGLTSLLTLPWASKFLWASAVDRYSLPGLGRRRSWLLPLQALAGLTLLSAAWVDPQQSISLVCGIFFLANLLAATQDIATDGLAVELLAVKERGLGNGIQVAGYRVGMIVGGGALLVVFHWLDWAGTFLVMALLLALASLPIVLYREPPPGHRPPLTAESSLRTLLKSPGMLGWMGVLLIYKFADAMGQGMLRPMLVDLGLSMKEIGWLLGTAGFTAGLVGALLGGALTTRLGRRRALVGFAALQALAIASYSLVPWSSAGTAGVHTGLLYALCIFEHLVAGMATAALFTRMMDHCRRGSEGSDYTLQACAVVVSSAMATAVSGYVAVGLGFAGHFVACGVLGLMSVMGVVHLTRLRVLDSAPRVEAPAIEQLPLASGRHCLLARPVVPVCEHYYVLFFPEEQGPPTEDEQREMMLLTLATARRFSQQQFGDPEGFTIIHNGRRSQRARNTHYHLLIVRTRWEKTSAYFKILLKNLLQAALPSVYRWLRRSWWAPRWVEAG